MYCPIKDTGAHVGSGEYKKGISLKSTGETPFEYPTVAGNALSLTRAPGGGVAGHTNHYGKCVLWSKLQNTELVKHGYDGPLTFTNPSSGKTFNVAKVHHWAWNYNLMFFFPENESVADCAATYNQYYGVL